MLIRFATVFGVFYCKPHKASVQATSAEIRPWGSVAHTRTRFFGGADKKVSFLCIFLLTICLSCVSLYLQSNGERNIMVFKKKNKKGGFQGAFASGGGSATLMVSFKEKLRLRPYFKNVSRETATFVKTV